MKLKMIAAVGAIALLGALAAGAVYATAQTPGVDISGPCDEAENANDPECAGATIQTNDSTRDDDNGRGEGRRDDGRRDDDGPGDISGPCDEAEHANDPECAGVTVPTNDPTPGDDDGPGDISGPCDEAEHANDPRCTSAAGDDDNSGPGNGDDDSDNSGPGDGDDDSDDNSGPGDGDDSEDNSGPGDGDDDSDDHGDDNAGPVAATDPTVPSAAAGLPPDRASCGFLMSHHHDIGSRTTSESAFSASRRGRAPLVGERAPDDEVLEGKKAWLRHGVPPEPPNVSHLVRRADRNFPGHIIPFQPERYVVQLLRLEDVVGYSAQYWIPKRQHLFLRALPEQRMFRGSSRIRDGLLESTTCRPRAQAGA